MKNFLVSILRFIYGLIEEFVLTTAFVVALFSYAYFRNTYVAISIFMAIPICFWVISSALGKRISAKKKNNGVEKHSDENSR